MHLTFDRRFFLKMDSISIKGAIAVGGRCTTNDQVENILRTFDNSCFCE